MQAAAFDFDGTLIDSMGMWRNLAGDFLASRGRKLEEPLATEIITMSLNTSIPYIIDYYHLDDDVEDVKKAMGNILLEGYGNTIELKKGAVEILENFKEEGYLLVLATATNEKYLAPALKRFDLAKYFEFVHTCDNSGFAKDQEGFYHSLADKLGAPLEKTYFFDDAAYALKTAKALGMHTVGVRDRHNQKSWDLVRENSIQTLDKLTDWTFGG